MLENQNSRILMTIILLFFTVTANAWWWTSDQNESSGEITELQWEDLIPEGFIPAANPLDTMSTEQIDKLFNGSEASLQRIEEIEEMLAYAPTDKSLNGKLVKIPGYIVPLDFDGQTQMNEFLIVPYFGACIHSPPPPANQVVHATTNELVTVEDPYAPVWAIGILSSETSKSDLAEAGYLLKVNKLLPYE